MYPRLIADDGLHSSIIVFDLELRQQFGPVAVTLAPEPRDMSAVPAIAEQDADGVRAGLKQGCDIVCLVVDALVIVPLC
jgi:hypothetical protein